MGICSFRSLFIAAIVLSNCIPWIASRHHFKHNVNGHRSRHRRQGAGLFLPASYVIPGGEGEGAWGEWGEVSACSRTCGGGVAKQKRICLEVSPDGQPLCKGGDTKYFSCQTQDCPESGLDFRSQQCAEYNDKLFKGNRYKWVPYTKSLNPCELNCMPHGERFYYRQQPKVVDGTRCNDESFDVCVDGVCQPVGCDMMLGSNAREDKCRQCRGNGTNCHTISGLIDSIEFRLGYNDVLLIPQGATNIIIEEVRASSNYLALRAKRDNVYYLNGAYHIDFPRSLTIAGTLWHYERSQQGLAAPDKLKCLGPTTEPLYLSILLQEENVGIAYEYSVPSALAPPPNQNYNWVFDEFSECNATCGGGYQERQVTCRSRDDLNVVDENLCDVNLKPVTNQSCNTDACPPTWVEGPWGVCSKPCGQGGARSREVYCEKIITNGATFRFRSKVADKECFDLLGPKPEAFQECNKNATCPTWFTGPWTHCDKLCGVGKQTRQVICHQRVNGRVEVFDDAECAEERPPTEQQCLLHPCDGVDWVFSEWSGCDTCLSTVRSRTAHCTTASHEVIDSSFCSYHPTPVLEEPCDTAKLPPCQVLWYASQWGNCSVQCGKGIQTREVFCGLFDGESVTKVKDEECDSESKFKTEKECEVPIEKCPAKWFAGAWSECTKSCNGGEQNRLVMCLNGGKESLVCPEDSVLDLTRSCNEEPCDKDEILPKDSKSTPIIEEYDYEDCEDEEEYPDESAEAITTERSKVTHFPPYILVEGDYDELSSTESEISTYEGSGYTETEESTLETELFSSSTESTYETTESTFESTAEDSQYFSVTTETNVDVTDSTIEIEDDTTVTTDLGSSESGPTDTTESTRTSYDSTESDTTDISEAGSSETTELNEAESSESSPTETTELGTTESGLSTTETSEASPAETTELGTSESTGFSSTESSELTTSSTSESGISESTTEAGTTDTSGSISTETSEFSTTEISETSSSGTSELSTTESIESSEPDSTETTELATSGTSESSTSESTTESGTADTSGSGSTETSEWSTTEISETSPSGTTESITTESIASTETGPTETTELATSDTIESGTSESTTESGTTDTSGSGSTETSEWSTTEMSEASSSETTELSTTESTKSFSTETTELSTSGTSESGTSESTTEPGTTETTGSGSTETTDLGSTDSTEISTTETTELSTTSSESTETVTLSTTEASSSETSVSGSTETTESEAQSSSTETTPWVWTSMKPKRPQCKPKKTAKCQKSKFGCCPDKKTRAAGPFDEGCPNPETCHQSKFGCCPDGVSPAGGPYNKGCEVAPCNETLYGCCHSDNITAAEDNDQGGCPPACKSSEYGCCEDEQSFAKGPERQGCPETETTTVTEKPTSTEAGGCETTEFGCCFDNETDASGPDGEGCPCSISEFGCCPDGIATAKGVNLEGCVMSCHTSAYGCCPDGETPAHGPEYEGCCLQYEFGCCPDNYKPAEGPHLEGCGCKSAHFGCCPDNETIARGLNNEGCGCQYSQFGCCPDGHTESQGTDFDGCACHTYQFGCCPDGVTAATGPSLQGCLCQYSKYGCCGDDVTAAKGPNKEGCDCSNSKFGCCPDGKTEAKGEKFLNCSDLPENKQAACALPSDKGSCGNYSVYWFYDVSYGGCVRFWYGGCEGNGNRFLSQEECEDVCVRPPPKDSCNLPKVKGVCDGYNIRWYYDESREQCSQFVYGGCLGNNNNFDSKELCQERCEPEKTEDQCNLPIEQGPCAGNFLRWGYNAERRHCDQFTWGGCEGNSNRFGSEAACKLRCSPPGAPIQACSLPQDAGNCTEKLPAWSFSVTENRCLPFYYTGCGGNENRFDSEQACDRSCPSAYVQEMCTLPAVTGECAEYTQRWYYDTKHRRCRQFYYGGCGGNENNFVSEFECENRCMEQLATTTVTPLPPITPAPTSPPGPVISDFCLEPIDSGPCTQQTESWAYDAGRGACTQFAYGGCGGNRNNFPSLEYCQYYCAPAPAQDICQLPMLAGPCDASLMRWFYDSATDSCSQFTYGGCEGNDNRFDSLEECERQCRSRVAATTTTTTSSTTIAPEYIPPECQTSPALEECSAAGEVWYLDVQKRACEVHINAYSGFACRNTGVFPSQEACMRSCGAFRDLDVCRFQVDPGPCEESIPKVYFDSATGRCAQFAYGGCHGGPNRFSSVEECEQVCRPPVIDPCNQPPEQGNCKAFMYMWHYDAALDLCRQFVYGGCEGNDNRFETQQECENRCKKGSTTVGINFASSTTSRTVITIPSTTISPFGPNEPTDVLECTTPSSVEPCGANVTVYYYDTRTQACLVGDFGGCRYLNSYRTEEECERRCGAFKGLDVCSASLDPGPCLSAITKYYWDAVSGRCLGFAYGGCHGGPNRFSSVEECEEVCGATGPAPEENEVSCDRYAAECAALRCEYGEQRTRAPGGCVRCECVSVEVDCAPLRQECATLKCNYGMERTTGDDGCERCRCIEHPCLKTRCSEEQRCVTIAYRDAITQLDVRYSAECRIVNKTGSCPPRTVYSTTEGQCRTECNDDADCVGVGKCCERGCSRLCLEPVSLVVSTPSPPHTTYSPDLPHPPRPSEQREPEVRAQEGGKATLRCFFHGNPPPKITWRYGEVTIDGDVGRYRLLSDGALEIISLYRNDTGVYICVADNGLGIATQEIRLEVLDPVEGPAGISGTPNAVVVGELGRSLSIRCLAYGYPQPAIYWYRGQNGPMVPYSSSLYEARGNVLQIRRLMPETLGEYICQAYNGFGKPADWTFVVQAYRSDGSEEYPYMVSRQTERSVTPYEYERRTEPTTTRSTEIEIPFSVPVRTRITTDRTRLSAGSEINLPCDVDGFPVPEVYWTKDGVQIQRQPASDRLYVTEARLTITRANTNDSGVYGCHANNGYTSDFSTVQISVEGLYIPPNCKDSPYFANCNLIVKSRFCHHKYYSSFCCKSCVEAGQLDPSELEMQADTPWRRK